MVTNFAQGVFDIIDFIFNIIAPQNFIANITSFMDQCVGRIPQLNEYISYIYYFIPRDYLFPILALVGLVMLLRLATSNLNFLAGILRKIF